MYVHTSRTFLNNRQTLFTSKPFGTDDDEVEIDKVIGGLEHPVDYDSLLAKPNASTVRDLPFT